MLEAIPAEKRVRGLSPEEVLGGLSEKQVTGLRELLERRGGSPLVLTPQNSFEARMGIDFRVSDVFEYLKSYFLEKQHLSRIFDEKYLQFALFETLYHHYRGQPGVRVSVSRLWRDERNRRGRSLETRD